MVLIIAYSIYNISFFGVNLAVIIKLPEYYDYERSGAIVSEIIIKFRNYKTNCIIGMSSPPISAAVDQNISNSCRSFTPVFPYNVEVKISWQLTSILREVQNRRKKKTIRRILQSKR